MKRVVALKVLSSEISRDPLFVKRFQREVETIACLGHPNIVMAYDADEAEAGHFLVMEFVNGRDLAACVERDGPFTVSRAVSCIEQAARGLAYAHQQEIVHRDIKPHNLLVDGNGVVKVTDLGLARLSHEAEAAPAAAAVTTAGGVLGTVDYMPPEQAIDSTAIDHRADIYSLGCTLHYLLTGRPPYTGATIMAILLKHRDAPIPRLADLRPDVPPRLEALFQRMLAKEPTLRVQTMSEVADELSAIARELAGEEKAIEWGPGETGAPPGSGSSSTIALKQNPAMTIVYQPPAETQSVLVVEPSRVQASIMRKFLESLSLTEAGVASTGRDALELIRTKKPRAVLCALHLPDMSGLQLAELIRSEVPVQAPGFVLVTSEAGEVAAEALVKLRRVLPLSKPFTPNQLKAAIESVMVASVDTMSFSIVDEPAPKRRIERRQARVLIVDDSSSARKYIRASLEKMGFT
ncbi:MAG TPA: serine/threonine-protein kinase, partial [Pirellulaceae bacterium]|nr:serine/threonine-protein kinase [Pirellulaceae bacterium]